MDERPTTLMDLILGGKEIARENMPSEKMYPFKTVMCPHCGSIQVTLGEEMFRCKNCNKVNRYRKRGEWNVKLKDFPTAEMALMEARRWAIAEHLKNN